MKEYILNNSEEVALVPGGDLAALMLSKIKDIKSDFYTEEGTIDYLGIGLSRDYGDYKKLAAGLRKFELSSLTGTESRLAFWINLYNTIVVDAIIALGVTESIKEVHAFFSRVKYIIDGEKFSPDDIEHGILRGNARRYMHPFKQFHPLDPRRGLSLEMVDPRIHFALVCGSRSCAPIKYYTAMGIDEELERAALGFINSGEVELVMEEKRIVLSKLLKWYEIDFGGKSGVLEFIARYLDDEEKKVFIKEHGDELTVEYAEYDWNLNK